MAGVEAGEGREGWPIRAYLLACVLLVALVIGGVGSLLRMQTLDAAVDDAEDGARYQATLAAGALADSLQLVEGQLAGLTAQIPVAQLETHPELCALSFTDQQPFPSGHLDLLTQQGRVFCSSLGSALPAGTTYAAAGWPARVRRSTGPVVVDPFLDPATGRQAVAVATAVRDARGTAVGSVAAVFGLPGLAANLAKVYGGPQHHGFTVLLAGAVLDSTDPRATAARPFADDRVEGKAVVRDRGWTVVAGLPHAAAVRAVDDALRHQLLLEAGALALLLLLLALINRRVARPLRRLTAAVAQATRLVPPAPLPLDGPRELRSLTTAFDALMAARAGHEDQLSRQSLHHGLTGLPNRALLLDRLAQALARARKTGRPVVLYCLDLDRFQLVNHTHGHEMGDRVLALIAQRLTEKVLPGDTVAHLAADEFFVLTSELRDGETAVGVGLQLAAAVAEPLVVDGVAITQTASVGVAIGSGDSSPEDLIRDADNAMARAKEQGRTVEVFDEDLRRQATERLQLQADLRAAFAGGELRVEYQPSIELITGRIVGVEALLRWEHARRGEVPPATFVKIAEDIGLIHEIGDFVLQSACTQGAAWVRSGYDLRVAVNVSGLQVLDPGFPARVRATLDRTGFPPGNLCLELTETTLVEGAGNLEALTRLRDLGVELSVDDFGTGYSSLAYLQQFPVNELKIDKAFVDELAEGDESLVRAMVAMGKALGLRVVAEGVENEQQLGVLAGTGCDDVQGFLLARPQRAYSVTTLLASRDQSLSAAWAAEHPGVARLADEPQSRPSLR
jgi:diguanylate cyclase (GGDEF)-like protein